MIWQGSKTGSLPRGEKSVSKAARIYVSTDLFNVDADPMVGANRN
jgi:hypothetical protein